MIARIEGKLIHLDTESALVQVGSIAYEVMLPGYCIDALSGQLNAEISLRTMEYYEGTLGGGNLIPRMVGFLTSAERDFFTRFISVKGMGIKKGLRALNIPIANIAAAIENGDEKTLLSLPAVGKRMAQQIIAELKGKLQAFAAGAEPAGTTRAEFHRLGRKAKRDHGADRAGLSAASGRQHRRSPRPPGLPPQARRRGISEWATALMEGMHGTQ